MAKTKAYYGLPYKAQELYAVLFEKQRASRSYSKKEALAELVDSELQAEFLKVCIEKDQSEDLRIFRRALLLVLQIKGLSAAAKATEIPRTTIYRMLWKDGNPNLKYLLRLLDHLGLSLWVVSRDFIKRSPSKRLLDEEPGEVLDVATGRRSRAKNWY